MGTELSGFSRVKKPLNSVPIWHLTPSLFGKLDWLNLTILAVFINPIMCYDLEK